MNLVKRVKRLPKPVRTSEALLPMFEAISNAIHSTQDKYGDAIAENGLVEVTVITGRRQAPVTVIVEDNGVGLDDTNFDAFLTTDTDNKIRIGGKGVGRLLWLDCFEQIHVDSYFRSVEGALRRRQFDFRLSADAASPQSPPRALVAQAQRASRARKGQPRSRPSDQIWRARRARR
jgi:hypothetical protein